MNKIVSTSLWAGGTISVGTANHIAAFAPADAVGGGITVVEAGIASRDAIASGSCPTFELVTLGTNSAINGTIGTISAAAFTAGTVRKLTITDSWVDGSEGIAWKVARTAANADPVFITGYFQYVMGK